MLVDLKFDKTNDGMVNGSDWRLMDDAEKLTYARMSLEAVGENPDAVVSAGVMRVDLFMEGLASVYK